MDIEAKVKEALTKAAIYCGAPSDIDGDALMSAVAQYLAADGLVVAHFNGVHTGSCPTCSSQIAEICRDAYEREHGD